MKNAGAERKGKKKAVYIAVSLAFILSLTIGGSLAWLKAETPALTNSFNAACGGTDITEEITGTEKTSVRVINKGTVPSYVRAAVTINCIDEEGKVLSSQTQAIKYNEAYWQYLDGFYYYRGVVEPNGETENLLAEKLDFDGKTVDIFAQTIQAAGQFSLDGVPVSSTRFAWGVDFDGRNWK